MVEHSPQILASEEKNTTIIIVSLTIVVSVSFVLISCSHYFIFNYHFSQFSL